MISQHEQTTLVFNGEAGQRDFICSLLAQAGYRVLAAADMTAALQLAKSERPLAIVSADATAHGESAKLASGLKSDSDLMAIPMLLVSSDPAACQAGMRSGLDDFLETPFHPMRLIMKVARLVERAHFAAQAITCQRVLRSAIAAFHDSAAVTLGTDGSVTTWSEEAEVITGFAAREATGRSLGIVFPVEAIREGVLNRQIERALSTGESEVIIELIRRNGQRLWTRISLQPLRRRQAESADGFLCILRDISSQRGAEQRLAETEQQLRQAQKLEAVGRLASGIAHDFNNLLTAIAGYSDLALLRIPDGNALRRPVEEIRKATESATRLTQQLLTFSRKQDVQPETLSVNMVVADIDGLLRRLIGENIDLVTVLDHSLESVDADRGQIEQIIVNLAVNARDAMPNGGKLTITTATVDLAEDAFGEQQPAEPGKHVLLSVSDTGSGIDEETRAHLFEPFFTTKASGRGTGLGLSMVQSIVQAWGGHICVSSGVGVGTTVNVYLPVASKAGASPDERSAQGEIAFGAGTILVVEDDQCVRELISEVLRLSGYEVIEAATGIEAIEHSRVFAGRIDLLLADLVMPQMSGRHLADLMRITRPDMRILFMSGYTTEAMEMRGIEKPEGPFLRKPFSTEELTSTVREVLRTNRQQMRPGAGA